MSETGHMARRLVVAGAFALGLGLGWAGATHRAIDESRARDGGGFAAVRGRIDAEEMRVLDLNAEQRQVFQAAREEAMARTDLVFARQRPEMDLIFQAFDQKVRPVLSPRQLAVFDRLERKLRQELPERPAGADD